MHSNKINRIRTFSLFLVFFGILIMYVGIFFKASPLVMTLLMLLGFILILLSTVIFFWVGMMTTKRAVTVQCPSCGKYTKMLGRCDSCMHCRESLTLDPSLEGKIYEEKYNSSKNKS
ncbi:DUF2614 family zinc ribbon-containing protein [Anaerobacillus sp. MEB173]|uniref:DUF2614 family zinc ribbon-containing protein n=1 Tax=Anaerobacillus sp. MEB173 TaxID=3383345 RepID=UPI003F8EA257